MIEQRRAVPTRSLDHGGQRLLAVNIDAARTGEPAACEIDGALEFGEIGFSDQAGQQDIAVMVKLREVNGASAHSLRRERCRHDCSPTVVSTSPMIRAGLPATMVKSGTSRVTTAPMPITAKRPTATLSRTTAPSPTKLPSPIDA